MLEEITIENIIASTHIGESFEPSAVLEALGPDRVGEAPFHGVVLDQSALGTAMLMFAGGRLVCTGARDFGTLERAFSDAASALRKCGVGTARVLDVNVINIVASGDLPGSPDLSRLPSLVKGAIVRYDPGRFEGLELEPGPTGASGKVTALLFGSGRVVFTGATEVPDLERAVSATAALLEEAGGGLFVGGE